MIKLNDKKLEINLEKMNIDYEYIEFLLNIRDNEDLYTFNQMIATVDNMSSGLISINELDYVLDIDGLSNFLSNHNLIGDGIKVYTDNPYIVGKYNKNWYTEKEAIAIMKEYIDNEILDTIYNDNMVYEEYYLDRIQNQDDFNF